ncbi:LAMI_0H03136g1_1 [Lachancea mirantina]|uniref:RING-type E3 ubiquitin transferase n=1 Tax=Lachancea mirantina TaxID=1230905 RepID=A0A1G4KEI2_9SACH|nr:LAMI_0H03136g1_1 [Lachancea mirantina]
MSGEPEFVNNVARWQPDELVYNCLNCEVKFMFLVRKHHCRCCGGIFCGPCSTKFLWYDRKRVKVVSRKDGVADSEFPPYRTCTSCYYTLARMKLLLSPWGERLRPSGPDVFTTTANQDSSRLAPQSASSASSARLNEFFKNNQVMENVRETSSECSSAVAHARNNCSDVERCPICNADLTRLSDPDSSTHIIKCIQMAETAQQHNSPPGDDVGSPTYQNRMLVYKMPDSTGEYHENADFAECPICFEEMLPGQKVGRLECLCMFHYDCIKSWFRKKTQKLKRGTLKYGGKNFCPLHDAVF